MESKLPVRYVYLCITQPEAMVSDNLVNTGGVQRLETSFFSNNSPLDHAHKLGKTNFFSIDPHCKRDNFVVNIQLYRNKQNMPNSCCVVQFTCNQVRNPNLQFAMLPRREIEPTRRALWLQVTRRGKCGDPGVQVGYTQLCVWKTSKSQVRHSTCLVQSVCNSTHYLQLYSPFNGVVGLGQLKNVLIGSQLALSLKWLLAQS